MEENTKTSGLLSALKSGERAKLVAINLPSSQKGRLMELGLTIGTTVEFVRVAPLGDPIEIKVRGSHLSLRKSDAANIIVSPL